MIMATCAKIETDRDLAEDGNTISSSAGNKISSKVKQVNQLKEWCFTFNNYTVEQIETIETKFREICVKYVFQEEMGEKGTPHLQGYIALKKRMRPSEFKLPKQIHWEATRNSEASIAYCQKEESRNGKVYKYGFPKPIKTITPNKWWQIEILELLKTEPDDRKIYWYWSEAGGVGKSCFVKYCALNHKIIFADDGKKSDIINHVFNNDMDDTQIMIFDIPRSQGNNVCYEAFESVKNGIIFNSKYETGQKIFNPPHIIVFANKEPKISEMSNDRWVIKNIDELIENE